MSFCLFEVVPGEGGQHILTPRTTDLDAATAGLLSAALRPQLCKHSEHPDALLLDFDGPSPAQPRASASIPAWWCFYRYIQPGLLLCLVKEKEASVDRDLVSSLCGHVNLFYDALDSPAHSLEEHLVSSWYLQVTQSGVRTVKYFEQPELSRLVHAALVCSTIVVYGQARVVLDTLSFLAHAAALPTRTSLHRLGRHSLGLLLSVSAGADEFSVEGRVLECATKLGQGGSERTPALCLRDVLAPLPDGLTLVDCTSPPGSRVLPEVCDAFSEAFAHSLVGLDDAPAVVSAISDMNLQVIQDINRMRRMVMAAMADNYQLFHLCKHLAAAPNRDLLLLLCRRDSAHARQSADVLAIVQHYLRGCYARPTAHEQCGLCP
eukprot:CAMPEP_0177644820 /NCGR_PEP_ID=MMETSP0447-20121125/8904_1 /TAXON_ID=0 /ORGANISM="Stygamoeba regulata, Strain BSH-02190019" /LENGTH=376 /DNA_ID=CAMNT_0019147231 /DNA_START=122 /DNA_END=1252 /DNA_ORIENTATION=-